MAKKKHVSLLNKGREAWTIWRNTHPQVIPDLNCANLNAADLRGIDLRKANLNGTTLIGANLTGSDLRRANLNGANLENANLCDARLEGANFVQAQLRAALLNHTVFTGLDLRRANLEHSNLQGADLRGTDLSHSNLRFANLREARLDGANLTLADLSKADLTGTDLSYAFLGATTFVAVDLRATKGLTTVRHVYPSTIDIESLFRSDGKIPELFLLGVGVPENLVTFLPSLLVGRAIEFYSCFISYSHQDEHFSQRLHSRMRDENLRVWFAPEDMKAGLKLHEEIFRAIQVHDKLLLVLSENSMKSEWVMSEIRRARKIERKENRRKLFPIRLIDFETIKNWECFDADSGKDLAVELREYYMPDFSNWKDHDSFEKEFAKLLRDLKTSEQ